MFMQLNFIRNLEQVQKLYYFVKEYPLDYPDYPLWLEKCKRQLEIKEKKAYYFTINDLIIGSLIFQTHKDEDSVLEMKNLRVSKEFTNQGIASKLERMVSYYGKINGFKRVRCDVHWDNFEVLQFLSKRGYLVEGKENLYIPNNLEIILYKDL